MNVTRCPFVQRTEKGKSNYGVVTIYENVGTGVPHLLSEILVGKVVERCDDDS